MYEYIFMRFMDILGDPVAKKTPKIIARAGQQLQMTCPISGYPIFNINWEKGMRLCLQLFVVFIYFMLSRSIIFVQNINCRHIILLLFYF